MYSFYSNYLFFLCFEHQYYIFSIFFWYTQSNWPIVGLEMGVDHVLKFLRHVLPKYWVNISMSKRKTLFYVFPKRKAIFLTSADGCNIHQAVIRFFEVGRHYYQLCWHLIHRGHQFDSPEEIGIFYLCISD